MPNCIAAVAIATTACDKRMVQFQLVVLAGVLWCALLKIGDPFSHCTMCIDSLPFHRKLNVLERACERCCL